MFRIILLELWLPNCAGAVKFLSTHLKVFIFVFPLKDFAKKNKGKIDYLLVQKWDRFSRNVGLGLLMIETLRKMGIEVNCVENWIDYEASDYIVMLSLAFIGLLLLGSKKENMLLNINRTSELYAVKEGGVIENHYTFLFQNTDS